MNQIMKTIELKTLIKGKDRLTIKTSDGFVYENKTYGEIQTEGNQKDLFILLAEYEICYCTTLTMPSKVVDGNIITTPIHWYIELIR